jgi:hypothetical protein
LEAFRCKCRKNGIVAGSDEGTGSTIDIQVPRSSLWAVARITADPVRWARLWTTMT